MNSVPRVQVLLSTIDENLSEYPRQTTIHGVKYLADRSRSLAERIFWIIMFTVSILLFSVFVYKIGRRWMEKEVIQIERNIPSNIFEIPFPAVTICPQIKFTKQKLDLSKFAERYANHSTVLASNLDSDYRSKLYMASQICAEYFLANLKPLVVPDFTNELMNNWTDVLMGMSPSFDQICFDCTYKSFQPRTIIDGEAFSTVITNEGVCFTFNTIHDILRDDSFHKDFKYHNITTKRDGWHPETGYTKGDANPFKGILEGTLGYEGKLKLSLSADQADKMQNCYISTIGYKIALHSPSVYPQMYDNFIEVDYGKAYKISVIPKTIETSNYLRSVSPDVRQCYFNDERKLQFYTFYNQQNCHLECYANFTKSRYGGVAFSSPRDSNTTNIIRFSKNEDWLLLKNFKFLHDHFKIYGYPENHIYDHLPNCNCLPECNGIYYDHKITILEPTGKLEYEDFILTEIQIVFSEPNFIGLIRVPGYTFETMLSDFGGLLGLFMGGSVLSLFELFYFVVIRNFFKSNVTENQS